MERFGQAVRGAELGTGEDGQYFGRKEGDHGRHERSRANTY